MRLAENIKQAFTALSLNKNRTILTMIGIIIGLSGVITIISIGDTFSAAIKELVMMNSSKNTFMIYMFDTNAEELNIDKKYFLTTEEKEELVSESHGLVKAIIENTSSYQAKIVSDRNDYSAVSAMGVSGGYDENSKIKMVSGRFISNSDNKKESNTAVISDKSAIELYGSTEDAIGKSISVRGKNVTYDEMGNPHETAVSGEVIIVGVYENNSLDAEKMDDEDIRDVVTELYLPYSYTCKMLEIDADKPSYYLNVLSKSAAEKKSAISYTESYLKERFPDDEDYHYSVMDFSKQVETIIGTVIGAVTTVFVLISGISLLVGGIGLMNTMLVSVTERTKEIGIKKALGAKNKEIRIQFLTEASVICLIACFIGVVLATFIGLFLESNIGFIYDKAYELNESLGYMLENNVEIHFSPSVKAIIISTVFSVAVGIIFGMYPANKGAKMQPVDALRYE